MTVLAKTAVGQSKNSSYVIFVTTVATRPLAPGAPQLAVIPSCDGVSSSTKPSYLHPPCALGASSVTLEWQAPLDNGGTSALNYTVFSSTQQVVCTSTTTQCTVYSGPGVMFSPSSTAQFFVVVNNSIGSGPASPPGSITFAAHSKPSPPLNVRTSSAPASGSMLCVTWDAPRELGGGTVSTYVILQLTRASDDLSGCDALSGSITSNSICTATRVSAAELFSGGHCFTGKTAQKPYFVAVAAIGSDGEYGQASSVSTLTTGAASAPMAPARLSLLSASSNAVVVAFYSPADTGGVPLLTPWSSAFIFQVNSSSGIEKGNTSSIVTQVTDDSGFQVTILGLTPGTMYVVAIKSVNEAHLYSGVSNISVSTLDFLPGVFVFSKPSAVVSENAGNYTVELNRVNGSAGSVDVTYRTNDALSTARAGVNYVALPMTLVAVSGGFAALNFRVQILDSVEYEDPPVVLVLSVTTSGTTDEWNMYLTLLDNGDAGTVSFSHASVSTDEKSGGSVAVRKFLLLAAAFCVSFTTLLLLLLLLRA
jgi:hypothetical protein